MSRRVENPGPEIKEQIMSTLSNNASTIYAWQLGIDWNGKLHEDGTASLASAVTTNDHDQTMVPLFGFQPTEGVVFWVFDITTDASGNPAPQTKSVVKVEVHYDPSNPSLNPSQGCPFEISGLDSKIYHLPSGNFIKVLQWSEQRESHFSYPFNGTYASWEFSTGEANALPFNSAIKSPEKFTLNLSVQATNTDGVQRTWKVDPEVVVGEHSNEPPEEET